MIGFLKPGPGWTLSGLLMLLSSKRADSGTPKCLYFHRKDDEDGQLTAAQIYLKLGEVGAESGRFSCTEAINPMSKG